MKREKYYLNSTKVVIIYHNNILFVSPIYTFSSGGNIFVYTPSQVQIGKSTLIILYTEKKCQSWREINTFPSIFPFIGRVFSVIRQKEYGPNP